MSVKLVSDLFKQGQPTFSFEFFPAKDAENHALLWQQLNALLPLSPSFVSVTYGAGGTTRQRTHELVLQLQQETELCVVAHLTGVGASRAEVLALLTAYAEGGVRNILALRGDPPRDQSQYRPAADGFPYAADLVRFIKEHFPDFCVGVAGFPEGHPATPNRLLEIDYLKAKVDAGADYIVSQLFFDNRDFLDFSERCQLAGIAVPIVAGVMALTSRAQLKRMAELAAGARVPAPLLRAIGRAADDQAIAKLGVHWAAEQIRDLLDRRVRGIHFYCLNQAGAALRIFDALGVRNVDQL